MVKQTISYKKPKVVEPVLDQNGLQFLEPTKETKLKEKDIFIDKYVERKQKRETKPQQLKKVVRNKKGDKLLNIKLSKSNDIDLNSVKNVMKEVSNM